MSDLPVFELTGVQTFNLVVVLQSDFYDFLETRMVIPISEDTDTRLDDIVNPLVQLEGRDYTLRTELLATISAMRLVRRRGELKNHSLEVTRAIDRLMTGV